jgi:predicted ATPase with chaperone activity
MAAGRKNMLATTWSNPSATKAMIGKKMARILPPMSSAPMAIHTARQTSQLQPTARMKIWSALSVLPLSSAMLPSRSLVMGMSRIPLL